MFIWTISTHGIRMGILSWLSRFCHWHVNVSPAIYWGKHRTISNPIWKSNCGFYQICKYVCLFFMFVRYQSQCFHFILITCRPKYHWASRLPYSLCSTYVGFYLPYLSSINCVIDNISVIMKTKKKNKIRTWIWMTKWLYRQFPYGSNRIFVLSKSLTK